MSPRGSLEKNTGSAISLLLSFARSQLKYITSAKSFDTISRAKVVLPACLGPANITMGLSDDSWSHIFLYNVLLSMPKVYPILGKSQDFFPVCKEKVRFGLEYCILSLSRDTLLH